MTPQLLLGLAAAPVVVAVVLVCLREPMRVALPLYAALIPFSSVLSIGPSRFGSLSSLVGIVLGAGLVLQLVRRRGGDGIRLSLSVPIWLLFLGIAGASVLWSLTPDRTTSGFIILGSLILIFVFVALSPVDRHILRRLENGLLAGGLAAVGYGLFQLIVLGGFPSDTPGVGIAPDGRFGNDLLGPNNQAVALVLPMAISLTRAVAAGDRTRRLAYAAASALMLGGVLMTGSRGGLVATAVALVALLLVAPTGRKTLLRYALVGLVVGGFVFVAHPFGIGERTVETTSSSGRTDIWRVGLAACPEYCGFGAGWGTFPDVYADTQASVPEARVLVGSGAYEPHNVWLLAAIELGLPGLLLLVAGLLVSLVEAIRLPAGLRAPPLSGLVATVVAASFLSNLEFKFFWMAMIVVVVSRNLASREAAEGARAAVEPELIGQR